MNDKGTGEIVIHLDCILSLYSLDDKGGDKGSGENTEFTVRARPMRVAHAAPGHALSRVGAIVRGSTRPRPCQQPQHRPRLGQTAASRRRHRVPELFEPEPHLPYPNPVAGSSEVLIHSARPNILVP